MLLMALEIMSVSGNHDARTTAASAATLLEWNVTKKMGIQMRAGTGPTTFRSGFTQ